MSRILNTLEADRVFRKEGIVQLPLISKSLAAQLQFFFNSMNGNLELGFHSTMFHPDPAYRKEVMSVLSEILHLPLKDLLPDYRILFANYILKRGGGGNKVGWHQDWSMTDEEIKPSVNVWIPLTDLSMERGGFFAWKGSHLFSRNIRYTPYPEDAYTAVEEMAWENAEEFYPAAGDALVYDGRILHASGPNLHPEPRLAVGVALVPESQPAYHFYCRTDGSLHRYESSTDFYYDLNLYSEPEAAGTPVVSEVIGFETLAADAAKYIKNPKPNIFFSQELEQIISENGYVCLKSALNAEELHELRALYQSCRPEHEAGFSISNWTNRPEYRESSHKGISRILGRLAAEWLANYRPVLGVFAVKQPVENSAMHMHQDWSLVDERKARSVSIWCPLGATNADNGNLQLVLKSHLDYDRPRGVNVPPNFSESEELSLRRTRLLDLPMDEGDVLIFDHRLIHCSPPNRSGSERVSAVLALIPEDESLIHHYAAPGSDGSVLEMLVLDPDDFYSLNFFDYARKPQHIAGLGFQSMGNG